MISDQHILVDSCIISYLLSNNKELRARTAEYINTLVGENNKLFMSAFTEHEVLRDIRPKQSDDAEDILKRFITITHTQERQKRATILYSAYSKEPKIRTQKNAISDIDVFIGSLIFTEYKPFLLTANYCDFPRPFFKESEIERIEYHNKDHSKNCIYYYIFQANLDSVFKKENHITTIPSPKE